MQRKFPRNGKSVDPIPKEEGSGGVAAAMTFPRPSQPSLRPSSPKEGGLDESLRAGPAASTRERSHPLIRWVGPLTGIGGPAVMNPLGGCQLKPQTNQGTLDIGLL
jgi:hypothetical protein